MKTFLWVSPSGLSESPLTIIHNPINYGVFNLNPQGYTVAENVSGGYAVINVSRTGGSSGQVTVYYKTIDGTAHAGTDYTGKTGQLTFKPGQTNNTFQIAIINNSIAQPNRTVNLQIYTPGGGATLGVTNSQLVIIDDDYLAGNVSFTGGIPVVMGTSNVMTYGTNENSGMALINVSRLGGVAGTLVAFVASGGGTASNGVNYVGFTNQITWNNGVGGPTNIFVPLMDDGVVTPDLTVNMRLFNTTVNGTNSALALGGVDTNAVLTITNVDHLGTVQFGAASYSFNENGGQAIIPVTRAGGSAGTISVNFATQDGTAVSNTDYVATNGTLVFNSGDFSKSFRVPMIDNSIQDGNRSLTLALTTNTPPLTNVLGSPNIATLTIVDDETYNQPAGSVDTSYYYLAGFNGSVFALALEPSDGKLVVGGGFSYANGMGRNNIARLNPDGTLDAKFSSYLPSQGPATLCARSPSRRMAAYLSAGISPISTAPSSITSPA